ncbi:hypothetical protein BXZ70DRAFT_912347 [Cristinia sonorae]|uniref:Zinc-finger domain-containing protein n=1 Tax=Cristinia sonorae TaxID=1940300 RepID=A0A8K0XVH7_9AGAR|nr:hypothetical protein BXZ70DRAFT_912347 [Cristinia sonorae]
MPAPSYIGARPPSAARRRSQVFVDVPRPSTPIQSSSFSNTPLSRAPRSQVYVEVPLLSRGAPTPTTRRLSMTSQPHIPVGDDPSGSSTASSLKENAPLRPSRTNSSSTSLTSLSSMSSGQVASTLAKDTSRKDKQPAPTVSGATSSNKRKLDVDDDELGTSSQPMSIAEKVKMKKPRLSRRQSIVEVVVPPVNAKLKAKAKSKVSVKEGTEKEKGDKEEGRKTGQEGAAGGDDADLYPNGSFYCHQCEKKRSNDIRLQCTLKVNDERCKVKYCKPCLRNRYDSDLDELRAKSGEAMPKSEKAKHISEESYYFECFKCKDTCNCKKCRRKHGLDPLGKLEHKKKPVPAVDPEAKPKKSIKAKAPPAGAAEAGPSSAPQQPATAKRKPRAKPASKPKPIPQVTWAKLDVSLSVPELEARVLIREFVHRFDGILQVSMSNVEELEELIGDSLGSTDEWEDSAQELVGWVSEGCVKAVIMGLLEVIAGRATALNGVDLSKAIKETIKSIRSSGANLNRIWSALSSLRDGRTKYDGGLGRTWLKFPDPLPPPATTTYRSTRSGHGADSNVIVACSAQMVPVVAFLVQQAIDSPAIREAIDLGITDVKDITQESKVAITKENVRFKEEKETQKNKTKEQVKTAKEAHLQAIRDLELGQKLALSAYAPRFCTLGRDAEGRVYYALTPSASECEAAEKMVTGKGSGKVKLRGKRGGFGEDERKEMKRWSWFLCVHGEKPEDGLKAKREDADEEDGMESDLTDEEEDMWWGFWDPAEIRKLAEWLKVKHGLDVEVVEEAEMSNGVPPGGPSSNGRVVSALKPATGTSKGTATRGPTTMTSSSRSSLKGKSRDISPLSDLSSSSSLSNHSSELSAIDSDVEMEDGFAQYSRPTAGKRELRALVKALTDYADMLQWRIGRVAPEETTQASATAIAPKEKQKKVVEAVPASRFYG